MRYRSYLCAMGKGCVVQSAPPESPSCGSVCGNDVVEPTEECEPNEFLPACISICNPAAVVSCSAECQCICADVCGDGTVGPTEECDPPPEAPRPTVRTQVVIYAPRPAHAYR